jgi:hypothetical protein
MSSSRGVRFATVLLAGTLALGSAVAWRYHGSRQSLTLEVRVTVIVCVQGGGCSQLPDPGAAVEVMAGGRPKRATADAKGVATLRFSGAGSFPLRVSDPGLGVAPYSSDVLMEGPSMTLMVTLANLCCATPESTPSPL